MIHQLDFDLHGIVGIRLLGASPEDAATVAQQLGPIQARLAREPDIIIRFVDHLSISSPIRYLGLDDVGFTDDAFIVLRSKHKARAKVQIPFEQVGQRCEIVCERGLPAVPLLIPILNLTVLGKGALPLHASAFTYQGTGFVATGWSKGGKTETLLAFMAQGAAYVGDEWVYLSCDGQQMFGIPEPIRVWDWHLRDLPQYRGLLSRHQRTKLRALEVSLKGLNQMMEGKLPFTFGNGRVVYPFKLMNRMKPFLKKQMHVDWPPEALFGAECCSLAGTPDKLVFVASHESPEVTIEPIDPQEVAQRMVYSLQEEQKNFVSYYQKFRFAFPNPEKANTLLEQSETLQRQRLSHIFSGKEAYAVYHPYPVPIPSLFDAISGMLFS